MSAIVKCPVCSQEVERYAVPDSDPPVARCPHCFHNFPLGDESSPSQDGLLSRDQPVEPDVLKRKPEAAKVPNQPKVKKPKGNQAKRTRHKRQ